MAYYILLDFVIYKITIIQYQWCQHINRIDHGVYSCSGVMHQRVSKYYKGHMFKNTKLHKFYKKRQSWL